MTTQVLDTSKDHERFIECDGAMRRAMRDQIGIQIVAATSGLRVIPTRYGIQLPVSSGMAVEVLLAANDTYVVRRHFTRRQKGVPVTFDHGERTEVYAEDLSEVVYYAGCYKSYDNGVWQTKA